MIESSPASCRHRATPVFSESDHESPDCTVGKKTVRMFVNIQRLLNKSRTIEVTDLKFSGYTVLYVVY